MRMIGIKSEGRVGDESDIVEFRLSEVNYISVRRATKNKLQLPLFHTTSGDYFPLRTIKEVAQAYLIFGFVQADRSSIVNTRRIKHMNQERGNSFIEFVDGTIISIPYKSK